LDAAARRAPGHGASGSAGGFELAAACAIDEDKPDDFAGSVTVLVAAQRQKYVVV
jgi:hypothetical protein